MIVGQVLLSVTVMLRLALNVPRLACAETVPAAEAVTTPPDRVATLVDAREKLLTPVASTVEVLSDKEAAEARVPCS